MCAQGFASSRDRDTCPIDRASSRACHTEWIPVRLLGTRLPMTGPRDDWMPTSLAGCQALVQSRPSRGLRLLRPKQSRRVCLSYRHARAVSWMSLRRLSGRVPSDISRVTTETNSQTVSVLRRCILRRYLGCPSGACSVVWLSEPSRASRASHPKRPRRVYLRYAGAIVTVTGYLGCPSGACRVACRSKPSPASRASRPKRAHNVYLQCGAIVTPTRYLGCPSGACPVACLPSTRGVIIFARNPLDIGLANGTRAPRTKN
ncbi:hypothetical protein EXIGLDRAFT_92711 [Exidia glandulosa HHB12029]|uniref:Uncharacterized protein n=1 Tax=Exidia glandulosa HHB12029 TaxID=1314781 RepID=A0A165HA87_EXIGL|nr:hypothetical protein EXIGLDRAFT_92711 [Exidia glandulosa HHB12029]